MKYNLSLTLTAFILFGCAGTQNADRSLPTNESKYPVSNKDLNVQYYNLSTNNDSPARVSPSDLENYISWTHAIDLILDGQVKMVAQAHSLAVSLELDNGSRVSTIEPSIDTVFIIIDKCGQECAHIVQVTE